MRRASASRSAGCRFVVMTESCCLLVPAVMVLLPGWAWWMPGLLERAVPHISIEDDSCFTERDAAVASGKSPAGS
jgi:uncharacterized membrane protein YdfJ with MMPL/SSD domain